jgi:hypothetical protein
VQITSGLKAGEQVVVAIPVPTGTTNRSGKSGRFPGGNFPGGNFPGGNFPGGNFPGGGDFPGGISGGGLGGGDFGGAGKVVQQGGK